MPATRKITELTEDLDPSKDDLVRSVKSPTGTPLDRKLTLANLVEAVVGGTNGFIARIASSTFVRRMIAGRTNEISVTDGDGIAGNPTVGIAPDPELPGSERVRIPGGSTAQRPGIPAEGDLRRNESTNVVEYWNGNEWLDLTTSGGDYVHPNHSGDVTSVGDGPQTISPNAVTNAKAADMPQDTIKGRVSSGVGDPEDLSVAQVRSILDIESIRLDEFAAPTSPINVNDQGLHHVGEFVFETESEVTLSSGGSIWATGPVHSVDTYGGAGADHLENIDGDVGLLMLRQANEFRSVTIKHGTSNSAVMTPDGADLPLPTHGYVLLYRKVAPNPWRVVGGSTSGGQGVVNGKIKLTPLRLESAR